MLNRLLSGAEESDSILILTRSTLASTSLISTFIENRRSDAVLISTRENGNQSKLKEKVTRVEKVKDILGWESGNPLEFSNCITKGMVEGNHLVVINTLTDLVIFYKPSCIARLLKMIKQSNTSKLKTIMTMYPNSTSDEVLEAVKQLFTTVIVLDNVDENESFPKLCKVYHKKVGGKLVSSKEFYFLDAFGNMRTEAYQDPKINSLKLEDEPEDVMEKLTTFNLSTSKDKEKEVRDSLVLPFYKEAQKENMGHAESVKIHGEQAGKIYYEPDSGDDWDDDDPDDDLDF